MKWLARLKEENTRQTRATNATNAQNVAFVAFISESETKTPRKTSPATELCAALKPQPLLTLPPPVRKLSLNPDGWCWPHGLAMNTQELDTFMVRLDQFSNKGLSVSDAEVLCDQLVRRDRDADDRRLCLECSYLEWYIGRWRCANGLVTGGARVTANAQLPKEITQQLQRCLGFTSSTSKKERTDEQ